MMSNLIPDCEKCPLPLPGDFAHTRTQGWVSKEEWSCSKKQGYTLANPLWGSFRGIYVEMLTILRHVQMYVCDLLIP